MNGTWPAYVCVRGGKAEPVHSHVRGNPSASLPVITPSVPFLQTDIQIKSTLTFWRLEELSCVLSMIFTATWDKRNTNTSLNTSLKHKITFFKWIYQNTRVTLERWLWMQTVLDLYLHVSANSGTRSMSQGLILIKTDQLSNVSFFYLLYEDHITIGLNTFHNAFPYFC